MKNKYPKNKPLKNSNNLLDPGIPRNEVELDVLAKQIDEISRRRLPAGVMGGILAGKEAEIRQDTAIKLLKGFLLGNADFLDAARRKDPDAAAYHLERVISIAMRICKSQLKRKLAKDQSRHGKLNEQTRDSCGHPTDRNCWELPVATQVEMVEAGLRRGVSTGHISQSNASVMRMVIEGQMSVAKIAERMGVTRGAVNQRLGRVRKVLPELMATVEVPMS